MCYNIIVEFQLTRSRGAWPALPINFLYHSWFQLTRSRGAWPDRLSVLIASCTFQLTRSRGAWRSLSSSEQLWWHFNSHAHVERDFRLRQWLCLRENFNSHAHVERDGVLIFFTRSARNFNSHAHVERDTPLRSTEKAQTISTHTLTWSVTEEELVKTILHEISTHTLTWSVTSNTFGIWSNSRISTHTLTWSVTHTVLKTCKTLAFQLTRSRGAWLGYYVL